MGNCGGCGGGKKKVYVVTDREGHQTQVNSLSAAVALVRQKGGHYQMVQTPR